MSAKAFITMSFPEPNSHSRQIEFVILLLFEFHRSQNNLPDYNKSRCLKQTHSMRHANSLSSLVTIRVEASALADGVPVLDVLPPATSKGVRPVLPNKERKTS